MKARIPWNGTPSQRKAMQAEINRQIIEADRKYTTDYDAMVLYTLHIQCGFGKKRLRRFYEAFIKQHEEFIKYYQMPGEYDWFCKYKLKEIGVDVDEWEKETEDKR